MGKRREEEKPPIFRFPFKVERGLTTRAFGTRGNFGFFRRDVMTSSQTPDSPARPFETRGGIGRFRKTTDPYRLETIRSAPMTKEGAEIDERRRFSAEIGAKRRRCLVAMEWLGLPFDVRRGTRLADFVLPFLVAATIWAYVDIAPRGQIDPFNLGRHKTDFTVYTEAGTAFFDGQDPYQVTNPRGWFYLYPPLFAASGFAVGGLRSPGKFGLVLPQLRLRLGLSSKVGRFGG